MGVPAFALPGEQVWAMGLHAGTRKRFKAEVVGLRTQFPRIIVKYLSTEDGVKAAIALPDDLIIEEGPVHRPPCASFFCASFRLSRHAR